MMNVEAISTLRRHLPSVFNPCPLERLPEDVYTHETSVTNPELNEIESGILDSLDLSEEHHGNSTVARPTPDVAPPDIDLPMEDIWPIDGLEGAGAWGTMLDEIRGPSGFPGAPERHVPGHGLPPSPDALAFYLPFHRFSPGLWGIYLTAEGVRYLTEQFYIMGCGYLDGADALRLARAFLFHHEAYHNAVEAFATRLEVAHRQRVYEAGIKHLFLHAASQDHEEALATAYAIVKAGAAVPVKKRKFAVRLLRQFVLTIADPYRQGAVLSESTSKRERCERTLQELSLQRSIAGVTPMSELLWKSAPYLMRPSLNRGTKFSYFIRRSSPLGRRLPLGAVYFDRRKILAKLQRQLGGGHEQAGGKHPQFVAPNGTRVSVPTGKTLAEGTVSSILKRLGITDRPRDFIAEH